jgi:two-component system cell cycle response regulator DivK
MFRCSAEAGSSVIAAINEAPKLARIRVSPMADPERLHPSAEASSAPAPEAGTSAGAAQPPSWLLGRILLVEDDPVSRYAMELLLRWEGYDVVLAGNGREGVEAAARERPDIVLMDVRTPELSGLDAARLIKASPELRAIPVIAMTAAMAPGEQEEAFEAGCDGYLIKPIDLGVLLETLRRWMGVVAEKASAGAGSR